MYGNGARNSRKACSSRVILAWLAASPARFCSGGCRRDESGVADLAAFIPLGLRLALRPVSAARNAAIKARTSSS